MNARKLFRGRRYSIALFGENIHYNENAEKLFIAAGMFVDKNNMIISTPNFSTVEQFKIEYSGHYACASISNDNIELFNDELGIRELFIHKSENFAIIATSPELIAGIIDTEINIPAFAGRWTLENQFGYDCIYKDIIRVVSKAKISIGLAPDAITPVVSSGLFTPDQPPNADIIDLLLNKIRNLGQSDKKITFMLSGGLDSRFLLALCLKAGLEFETVSIGPPDHPDNAVAKNLASISGIKHTNIPALEDSDKIIDLLPEFIVKSRFTAPASELVRKYVYKQFNDENRLLIDGSFGEIIRRGFFNKLVYRVRGALITKNEKMLAKALNYPHADVFNSKFDELMLEYSEMQIERALQGVSFGYQDNPGDVCDVLGVRDKLLNYNNIEQNRIDGFVINYCPFSQHDVINAAFALNFEDKNNGKLMKEFIYKNSPDITKLPLIKGVTKMPFTMNTLNSKILAKLKKSTGFYYSDKTIENFLRNIKEYSLDILSSQSASEYEFYDKIKLNNYIERYNKDDYSIAEELDWLVTFEMFRRSITNS